MSNDTAQSEMPCYICHKQIEALKIAKIELIGTPAAGKITPVEDGYGVFLVTFEYMEKHKPHVGGYFVRYKDGYCSFSPAKAFEEGYTKE